MSEGPRETWRFFIRAVTRWMLAAIAIGAGAGIIASGFIFGIIASPTDQAVRGLAPWFELTGPAFLIIGAVVWGLLARESVKRAASLEGAWRDSGKQAP